MKLLKRLKNLLSPPPKPEFCGGNKPLHNPKTRYMIIEAVWVEGDGTAKIYGKYDPNLTNNKYLANQEIEIIISGEEYIKFFKDNMGETVAVEM